MSVRCAKQECVALKQPLTSSSVRLIKKTGQRVRAFSKLSLRVELLAQSKFCEIHSVRAGCYHIQAHPGRSRRAASTAILIAPPHNPGQSESVGHVRGTYT